MAMVRPEKPDFLSNKRECGELWKEQIPANPHERALKTGMINGLRPSPLKINGLRPSPLKINKDSHLIQKPVLVPAPKHSNTDKVLL
ncbi:protein MKS1-like protein [Corchorus olitorius]|uniref:Protein MKS1-like protein n=1 Tax=Corchorus olitorius TaxID=93759 RepID=A0A1R3ISQ2_9ROSI|nr:protein MKS1-like protein [Corchorus olitorius]